MIRFLAILSILCLFGCRTGQSGSPGPFYPQAGQGQYVRPAYLNPVPTPRVPPVDACQSQLYLGLIGQSEGAIYLPGLPGAKRVLKPAFDEGFDGDENDLGFGPTYMEVRDYLPGQSLYAPSIRTPGSLLAAADTDLSRLTIELDVDGYVQEIRCG